MLDDDHLSCERFLDAYMQAYTAWHTRCCRLVDPRVLTHCRVLVYPGAREEFWCDGVLVGVWRREDTGNPMIFVYKGYFCAAPPATEPPV